MVCEIHGVEMKTVPAGVSKKTGKPYNSFLACPEQGCNYRPPRAGGWSSVREQVAQKVAPEKAVMTKEDWERKEERTNKNILLQVAFKAAVELTGKAPKPLLTSDIYALTLEFHSWLLSQMNYEKPARSLTPKDFEGASSGKIFEHSGDEPPLESFINDPNSYA